MKTITSSSDLAQKLFFYGLSAGAASLGAASASATIYYSGPLSVSGNTVNFDVELTGAGAGSQTGASATGTDFKLTGSTSSTSSTNKISTESTGATVATQNRPTTPGGTTTSNYILRLAGGDTIGSNLTFTSGYSVFNTVPGVTSRGVGLNDLQGDWLDGDRGFVGLTIVLDGTGESGTSGVTVFGWADVTINNFDNSTPGRFTLNGYAYELDGGAIPAGAIPEPSTVALLIAGAAGVAVIRQRRSARKS